MHRNVLIANVTGFSLSSASMSLLNLGLAQSRTSDLLESGNMMIRARYILPDWDIVLPLSRCQHWVVFLTLKSLLFLLSFSLLLSLHISHPSPLVSSLFSVSSLSLFYPFSVSLISISVISLSLIYVSSLTTMSTLAFADVPVTLRACTRYPCHAPLILHLPRSPRAPTSPLSSVSNRLDMEPVQSPSSETFLVSEHPTDLKSEHTLTYDPEPSTIQRDTCNIFDLHLIFSLGIRVRAFPRRIQNHPVMRM